MLKIKEPVKLKSYNNMCILDDRFAKRIQANYDLFHVHFTTEELLYLMQGNDAEQYIEQHNMTCIVNNTHNNNNITLDVEVINEFINRFFEIINGKYTYQDRLYIDRFLIKAGIHNVNSFIKNAINYVNDTKEVMSEVEFVNNNEQILSDILKELVQNNNSNTQLVDEYLSNNRQQLIMKFSGKLLSHIINEDNKKLTALNTTYKNSYVDISRLTSNMQYQKLELCNNNMKQDMMFNDNTDINMQFHSNPYEIMWQDSTTKEKVLEQLISASLLNILESFELVKSKEAGSDIHIYINQNNNLSDIITSTILRMITGQKVSDYNIAVRDYEEVKMLKKEQHSLYMQLVDRYEHILDEPQAYNDLKNIYTTEKTALSQMSNNNSDVINNDNTQILQQEDNQNYIENNYQTDEDVITDESIKVQIDREKARKDVLTAIDNPMQVINEYNKEMTDVELYHKKQKEMLYEGLPQESRELFEKVEKILGNKAETELKSMQESAEHSLFADTNNAQPLFTFEDYEILQLSEVEDDNNQDTDVAAVTQQSAMKEKESIISAVTDEIKETAISAVTDEIKEAAISTITDEIKETAISTVTDGIKEAAISTVIDEITEDTQQKDRVIKDTETQDNNILEITDVKAETQVTDYQIQVLKEAIIKNRYTKSIYSLLANPADSYNELSEFYENKSEQLNITAEQTEDKFYEALTYILREYTDEENNLSENNLVYGENVLIGNADNAGNQIYVKSILSENKGNKNNENNIQNIREKSISKYIRQFITGNRGINNTADNITNIDIVNNADINNIINDNVNTYINTNTSADNQNTLINNTDNTLVYSENALTENTYNESNQVYGKSSLPENINIENNIENSIDNIDEKGISKYIRELISVKGSGNISVNNMAENASNINVNVNAIADNENTVTSNTNSTLIYRNNTLTGNTDNESNQVYVKSSLSDNTDLYASKQYIEYIHNVLNISENLFQTAGSSDYYNYTFNSSADLLNNKYTFLGDTANINIAGSKGNISSYGDTITNRGDIAFVYNNEQQEETQSEQQPAGSNVRVVENTSYYNNNVTVKDNMRNNMTAQIESSETHNLNGLDTAIKDEIHTYETRIEHNIQKNVERTIDNQIASISEKVYSNLEKRLSMERKRRGY